MTTTASTFLITGASSGLGLAVARRLAAEPTRTLILPVRNAARAETLRAALAGTRARLETPLADLAALASVRALVDALAGRPLAALACIAGLQFQHGRARSADGYEATFAVNQLAHVALLAGVWRQLEAGAPVLFVGSGTHDTRDAWARLFGFRGGRYTSAARLAAGDCGPVASDAQHGRDLYATSKLCNLATMRALARQWPAERHRFLAIDPGLMPGTGLAREAGAVARFAWTRIMAPLLPGLPGVSSAARSGATLADLVTGRFAAGRSGVHVDYRGIETAVAPAADDPALADDLLRGCLRLVGLPETALSFAEPADRDGLPVEA